MEFEIPEGGRPMTQDELNVFQSRNPAFVVNQTPSVAQNPTESAAPQSTTTTETPNTATPSTVAVPSTQTPEAPSTTSTTSTPTTHTESAATTDTIEFSPAISTNEAPSTPAFNSKELLGIELGLEEIKKRVMEYEKLETEIKNKYANAESEMFDKALREGISPESYWTARNLDIDKLTPVERVVKYTALKNGISEEDAKAIVSDEYSLDLQLNTAEEGDELSLEQTKENEKIQRLQRSGQARLNIDDKTASEYLNKYKVDLVTPVSKQIEQATEQITKSWSEPIENMVKGYEKLKFKDFEYNTSQEGLKSISQKVLQTLHEVGATDLIATDPKSQEVIKSMIDSQWWAENGKAVLIKQGAHYAAELLKYKHNPITESTAVTQKTEPAVKQEETAIDFLRRAAEAGY